MQKNYYNHCNISGNNDEKCWLLHPELKPQGNNGNNRNNGDLHNHCGGRG